MTQNNIALSPVKEPSASNDAAYACAPFDMFREIIEALGDMIIRYDANSRRVYVSPSCRDVLGYLPDDLVKLKPADLIHPDDLPKAEAGFLRMGPMQPIFETTLRLRRKSGEFIWCEQRYRHIPRDDGVLLISRDITASKAAEEQLATTNGKLEAANAMLQEMAQYDPLTGLANRRLFDERLAEAFHAALHEAAPLGLVMVDADCFKAYNDSYGHIAGDQALCEISRAVRGVMRRASDLAARYGGEEIVVLLPGCDQAGATLTAERICQSVAALNIAHGGNPYGYLTVSAGAASTIPNVTDKDPASLIRAADSALYTAKTRGRNRVHTAETLMPNFAAMPAPTLRSPPIPTEQSAP